MPMYMYVAKDQNGKTKKDIVEALGEQSLIDRLQNEGLFVVSVKPIMEKKQGSAAESTASLKK